MSDDAKPTRVQPERKRGGTWVPIGDEEYRIPALSFQQLEDIPDLVGQLRSSIEGNTTPLPQPAQIRIMRQVILMAMNRNYPSMTEADLGEMLDLGNAKPVFEAVLVVSGMRRTPDQGESQGER